MTYRVKLWFKLVAGVSLLLLFACVFVPASISAQAQGQQSSQSPKAIKDDPITDIAGEASSVKAERSANNLVLLLVGIFGLAAVTLTAFRYIAHTNKLELTKAEEQED